MTILDRLAQSARERVAQASRRISPAEIRRMALSLPAGDFGFERALSGPGMAFICECKKASPSRGLISPEFPYLQLLLTEL